MTEETKKDNLPAVPLNADGLRTILTAMTPAMKDVLPTFLTAERMLKIAMLAATRQPSLYKCTTVSIMQAVMTAAEVGLECSGTMGQGYLIPYKTTATFIPGYRGLIALMMRDGDVKQVTVHLVHEKDIFEIDYFGASPITHRPCTSEKRGPMIGAYAAATMPDGSIQVEYMNKAEIDAIKNRSKASGGPWSTDYGEMARKTPVRRLAKYVPLGINAAQALATAVAAEDATFGAIDIEGTVIPPIPGRQTRRGTESLHEALQPEADQEPETEPKAEENATTEAPEPSGDLGL